MKGAYDRRPPDAPDVTGSRRSAARTPRACGRQIVGAAAWHPMVPSGVEGLLAITREAGRTVHACAGRPGTYGLHQLRVSDRGASWLRSPGRRRRPGDASHPRALAHIDDVPTLAGLHLQLRPRRTHADGRLVRGGHYHIADARLVCHGRYWTPSWRWWPSCRSASSTNEWSTIWSALTSASIRLCSL